MNPKPRVGSKSTLPAWAEAALRERLEHPDGVESYGAIQQWLATQLGIVAPYKTVHKWGHYRLKASPKVPRPQSDTQDVAQLATYKKTRWEFSHPGAVCDGSVGMDRDSAILLPR